MYLGLLTDNFDREFDSREEKPPVRILYSEISEQRKTRYPKCTSYDGSLIFVGASTSKPNPADPFPVNI